MSRAQSKIAGIFDRRGSKQPTPIIPSTQQSLIELSLPPELILTIFDHLPPPNGLCFALCSKYFWTLYRSINSEIPSLWTPTTYHPSSTSPKRSSPPGYPHDSGDTIPLGSLLTEWIGPDNYRTLRPAELMPTMLHNWVEECLPPYFIRRTWQDRMGVPDTDGRLLIGLYRGYWRVSRDGKKILPHPKGMSAAEWQVAAKRAVIVDAEKWETFEDWAQWWIHADRARFYALGKQQWADVRKGFKERRLRVGNEEEASQ